MRMKLKHQINDRYIEKKRDKLLQKRKDRNIHIKELVRACVELKYRLKALKQNFSINDSENNRNFSNEIYYKQPKKILITNKTDVYHTHGNWSLDILYIKDYYPENKRC